MQIKEKGIHVKYEKKMRKRIALATLAVIESGCHLEYIHLWRVWFTFDGEYGTIHIFCSEDGWEILWDFCGNDVPMLKTYEELLAAVKKEKHIFEKWKEEQECK